MRSPSLRMKNKSEYPSPPPPWGLHAVLCRLKGPLKCGKNVDSDELTYQKLLSKKNGRN